MIIASGIAALILALVHLFASNIKQLHGIPRSRWLSMAGGASVAYVFIHILPELKEWQEIFEEEIAFIDFLSHHLYFIALIGLTIFYGLERAAKLSEESDREDEFEGEPIKKIYIIHIVSFAFYNALFGYLLVQRDVEGYLNLVLFTVAIALHFIVNDYGLLDHYHKRYIKKGRWILAGSIIAGWIAGALTEVSQLFIAVLFAFLAGGIVLNVLKEELPEERKSRYWAFLLGVIVYGGLLLVL